MKSTLLSAAVLAAVSITAAPAVLAQAPEVPKLKCDKPEYPGRLRMQSDNARKVFERDMKSYKDCITGYIDQRKAAIEANQAAAQAAVDEHNTVMKKVQDEQREAAGK